MPLAYVPPRITINETVSPSFNPTLVDPNSICVVGPAQGFQTHTETVLLNDNSPVTLSASYPDVSTISVVDASNVTTVPFAASTPASKLDYDIDISSLATTGAVTLARSMQTTIANGETVSVYFENSASPAQSDGHTALTTLNSTTSSIPVGTSVNTQAASVVVAKTGAAPVGDYTVANSGAPNVSIVWRNTATVLTKFQTVYLDFAVGSAQFHDVPVQLNNLTTVALTPNAASIVVKTAPGANTAVTASRYQKGSSTDLDYIVTGTGSTTAISRSAGTTTIGLAQDKLVVRVSYQATPVEYWFPRRCFSQGDVEDVFGPAFDNTGNIINPVSFAASATFANGVNSVIVQALFQEGSPRVQPTGSVVDWQNTLKNLRDVEDITVIVPIVSAGGLATSDAQNLQILEAVQDHVNYMAQQQQNLIIAICGEDSTSGTLAPQSVLQDHAESLAARTPAQSMVLVSPGAFTYTNPVTGLPADLGGQYAAACVAGLFGQYAVQMPFTRKRVNVLIGVKDRRTEQDKNADAASGLLVIESKRGITQVRHAITVANDVISNQELNVVRAKYWMMTSLSTAFDTQVVGNYIIDANTPFQVQLQADAVLQSLQTQGAIVSYRNIQVRRNPQNPTGLQVQFSYLPAFGLNYIDIAFSLDSAQGVQFSNTSPNALPTQGQGL